MEPDNLSPALQEPIAARIFALLQDQQRRAIEGAGVYCVGSAKGFVRQANEDVGLIARWRVGGMPDRDLDVGIVCDGMGGMRQGRLAAQLAASVFVGAMFRQARQVPLRIRAERALITAQNAVYQRLRAEGGTTLTAVCLEGSRACLTHVGDSRAYEVDENGQLMQLTRDDTLGAALNRAHEDRFDLNRLIQFVGMQTGEDGGFEPQIVDLQPKITRTGFLLTSDGAHGAGKDVLQRVASHMQSPLDLVRKVLLVADAFGGQDNATAAFLPHMSEHGSQSPGVSLSLTAPNGEAQVWFSAGFADVAPAAAPAKAEEAVPSPATRPAEPARDAAKRHTDRPKPETKPKPKKKAAKKSAQKDPALPLEDAPTKATVHFPGEDDEAGA